jgi:phosphate transport system permease protein
MTAVARPASSPLRIEDLRIGPRRRFREAAIRVIITVSAAASIVISLLIVLSLIQNAIAFATQVDPAQLVAAGWFPRRDMFSIPTIVGGTLVISAVGMLIATPLGIGAAIYLSEYASPRMRKVLKPVLEILAAIPSVVLGYFAITVISRNVVSTIHPGVQIFNMASAGIAVGILITPLIASVAEDALHAVPNSLREASYGLGARRLATSMRVVVPAAVSGMVAALILGLSRAIGETMIVAIAAGATGGSLFTINPFDPGITMTAAMTALATGSDQVRGGAGLAFPSLFFVGLLLFVFTLALNLTSEAFVRRFRQRY